MLLAVDLSIQNGDEVETFGKLKEFLLSNIRVQIQASPFIMGLGSERQTASVVFTLANKIRKLSFPDAFWVLSGNQINLNVNNPENNIVISALNQPKNDTFISPLISAIMQTTTKQMMQRGMKQSFILLDEAPTIRLLNMARISAIMKSFGVSTIYAIQDIVHGLVQYGKNGFKEITANLGTQIFGKSNDPDTAKFYEGFFEIIKEKTKSINTKGEGSLFSTVNSASTGEREIKKVRSDVFMRMKIGEFALISDGNSKVIKFNRAQIKRDKLKIINDIKYVEIQDNYGKIISEINELMTI